MAVAALDELRSLFVDSTQKVVTSAKEDEYQVAVTRPWSQMCWTPAAGYIFLSTVEELKEALAIVRKTGTKFAIRTSGHNPNQGVSSADETALVLDIGQLNSKEILSTDKGIARFGAGNKWGDVYGWLEERGLSTIGGRDMRVGMGGSLLGGGYGALPNLYGLGADGVKNFEVLLADGSLVNANADENPDLYRALKGGGANFGIVTHFHVETHPLVKIQYSIKVYNPEDHLAINNATIEVQQAMEEDPKIGLFTNFNTGFAVVGVAYGDHPTEPPKVFKPFDDLKSLMSTAVPLKNGTLLSLAKDMTHVDEPKKRYIFTFTTKISHDFYEEVYEIWNETCKSLPTGATLNYIIQPFGTAAVQAGKDRGGNILGHESVPQCWWVFTCEWPKDGSDDEAAKKAVHTVSEKVQSLAKSKGLLLDYISMSFANTFQKVLGNYGAENIKLMQEVAAKYDPEGVFQNLQVGGFLLRDNI